MLVVRRGEAQRSAAPLPASSLAVERDGRWVEWWRAERAPARWSAPLPMVVDGIAWRRVAEGVEWGELRLAGSGEAWRTRAIVVRIDPARVRIGLAERSTRDGSRGAWTIDSAPPVAIVALNAGQFVGGSPWGWVVANGAERYSPGAGPLATIVAVDTGGRVRWLAGEETRRVDRGAIRTAIQSYPTLLDADGVVPAALRAAERGVDVAHRDARLAVGALPDGRLLVALTRFDALGGRLDAVPLGLTTPEMAALMGALGCTRAVALDGGISAQLLVRAGGETHRWPGLRRVPLGLVIEGR